MEGRAEPNSDDQSRGLTELLPSEKRGKVDVMGRAEPNPAE